LQSSPNSANAPLRLSGKLVDLSTWQWLGIGSVVALFVLKGIQGCLEGTVTSPLGFIVYAFTNRYRNVSLWFVIFGFLSIWIIVGLIPDLAKGDVWTDGIHIPLRWVAFAIALSVVEIGLYLSATYRDGGTFFIQIKWGNDRTTFPGVYAVQVIEGLLNCILLSTMSLWVAIAHAAVSELNFYWSEGRAKLTAKMLNHIVWAALFPVLSFLGLSAAKITLDWQTGIANAAFAVTTAILMWALFFWLMLRLVTDPYVRIEPIFTLPFFKVELRDRSPTPNLRLYQHPGFNAAFVLQIPDALFEEAEKTNPDRDKAIFDQFSQSEKENLMKHFLAAASLDKFKYEAWLVEFRELEGKPMIKGEAGRTFWIWRSPA